MKNFFSFGICFLVRYLFIFLLSVIYSNLTIYGFEYEFQRFFTAKYVPIAMEFI